ncbi:MAG: sialidase family protein [Methanobacteriota archaeon]
MRRAPALLAVVLLAGCVGPPADDEGTGGARALRFADPVRLMDAGWASEPNVVVHPDGRTAFVVAAGSGSAGPNVVDGDVFLWRSEDAGDSWEAVRTLRGSPLPPNPAARFCSCDADVDVAADGRVYIADSWKGPLGTGNFVVQSSTDRGETWSPGSPVTAPSPYTDRQWIVPGSGAVVYLAYRAFGIPAGLWMSRSEDAGARWSGFFPVVDDSQGTPHPGKPRLVGDARLLFPYALVRPTATYYEEPAEIRVAISDDRGEGWRTVAVADEPHGTGGIWPVEMAVRGDEARLVWRSRGADGTVGLRSAASVDGGASWSSPQALTPARENHLLPWAAFAPDGTFAVAAYSASRPGDPAEMPPETQWFPTLLVVPPDPSRPPTAVRVTEAPSKEGALCAHGGQCRSDRELLEYLSVAALADGRLLVASTAVVDGEARVFVARTDAPP